MIASVRKKLVEYVLKHVPVTELLAMIAEEAAELGHAALKLRRAFDGTNPTPVTIEDALEAFQEEVADVLLLVVPNCPLDGYQERQDIKLRRWADRLREKEEQSNEDPEDA